MILDTSQFNKTIEIMIKEMYERFKLQTPIYFKKIRRFGIYLGALGSTLQIYNVANPESLPHTIVAISGYLIAIGLTASGVATTAKE